MRFILPHVAVLAFSLWKVATCAADDSPQQPLKNPQLDDHSHIPVSLFADLERLSRLVDISYCIGNSGVSKPFDCVSRCRDFPTLALVRTWNTGILLSDSCGFIALDHGPRTNGNGEAGEHGTRKGLPEPERAIVVAFRGTYSVTNTVIDLSTIPQKYMPYPAPDDDEGGKPRARCHNCTVHMGFYESWKNARKLVVPELVTLKSLYPEYPIHLVGHSLGGAVACLAALELKVSLGYDDVVVTTFGEPRLGNEGLARYVDDVFRLAEEHDVTNRSYRRVTHYKDPVPLLPLDQWGYRSHAGEIYIAKESLPPSQEDIRPCVGNDDPECSTGVDTGLFSLDVSPLNGKVDLAEMMEEDRLVAQGVPTRFKLWQLFFAHRDYFWRLGLCVPGGDPADWGREKYGYGDDA